MKERFRRLAHIWLDQGYTGAGKAWIEEHLGWATEIVRHAPSDRGEWRYTRNHQTGKLEGEYVRFAPEPTKGFKGVLPRRWVVERTFSWFGQSRRLSKDYERLPATEEAMIYWVTCHECGHWPGSPHWLDLLVSPPPARGSVQ